jgi:hypothetical protein
VELRSKKMFKIIAVLLKFNPVSIETVPLNSLLYNNIFIFPSEEEYFLSVFLLPDIPIKVSKVHSVHNV